MNSWKVSSEMIGMLKREYNIPSSSLPELECRPTTIGLPPRAVARVLSWSASSDETESMFVRALIMSSCLSLRAMTSKLMLRML